MIVLKIIAMIIISAAVVGLVLSIVQRIIKMITYKRNK